MRTSLIIGCVLLAWAGGPPFAAAATGPGLALRPLIEAEWVQRGQGTGERALFPGACAAVALSQESKPGQPQTSHALELKP